MNFIQGYFLLMLLNWLLIEQYSSCLWHVVLFTKVWCFHSIKKTVWWRFRYYTKEFETSKATNTHKEITIPFHRSPQMALCDINHCWVHSNFHCKETFVKRKFAINFIVTYNKILEKLDNRKKIKRKKNGECSGIKRDVRQLPLYSGKLTD